MTKVKSINIDKVKVVYTAPCPYKPIGNGLAIVDIKQMIDGYSELKKVNTPETISEIKKRFVKAFLKLTLELDMRFGDGTGRDPIVEVIHRHFFALENELLSYLTAGKKGKR